ncbi:unnamed protein product [Gordionus sp. m RMFG-2023]
MFPTIKVRFSASNIDPNAKFIVGLEMKRVDNIRYRYSYNIAGWLISGKRINKPTPANKEVVLIYSGPPLTGKQLVKQRFSFEKVKLTNNEIASEGQFILNSMHKYQPIIHLMLCQEDNSPSRCNSKSYIFKETQFMAVTAYQNQMVS